MFAAIKYERRTQTAAFCRVLAFSPSAYPTPAETRDFYEVAKRYSAEYSASCNINDILYHADPIAFVIGGGGHAGRGNDRNLN